MRRMHLQITFFILLFLSQSTGVQGTIGYFAVGYGTKAIGMGGVATAYPQDSLVAATNPAGMYWVGSRFDIGLQGFSPPRKYSYNSPFFGRDTVHSKRNIFPVPHIGYNRCVTSCLSLGVSMYGNGGLNTHYPRNNPVFGTGKLGVDYVQLIMAPTAAYRAFCNHSFGVSLLVGMQRIRLLGLQGFRNFSSHPNHVTNKGYSYAVGLGVRLGWVGEVYDGLWLGAAYTTKTYMTKHEMYKGLLAGARLDIPSNFSVGFKYAITPCIDIAFDYLRIFYSDVRAIGNSISRFIPGNLGEESGPGFGWRDISAYKFGIDYAYSPCFIMRAGYAISEIPYSKRQIDFNIIAPAVVTQHFTIGFTYEINRCGELDIAYSYSPRGHRKGNSNFGLGRVKHEMYQHLLEINYGWK